MVKNLDLEMSHLGAKTEPKDPQSTPKEPPKDPQAHNLTTKAGLERQYLRLTELKLSNFSLVTLA